MIALGYTDAEKHKTIDEYRIKHGIKHIVVISADEFPLLVDDADCQPYTQIIEVSILQSGCRLFGIADMTIWAGLKLTNTSVTATDNDQAFFRYASATNSGKWQAINSIDGTDTATDSGVTVAATTFYRLRVNIDSSRIARFYINGTLVATSAALKDATDLIPYIGVQANTGAAKAINIIGQAISRKVA